MHYGCEHEHKAVNAYKLQQFKLHQGFKVTPSGFVLYTEKACFSASPDSFVEYLYYGLGVLEVKCPYCIRSDGLDAALGRSSFCLRQGKFRRTCLLLSVPVADASYVLLEPNVILLFGQLVRHLQLKIPCLLNLHHQEECDTKIHCSQ